MTLLRVPAFLLATSMLLTACGGTSEPEPEQVSVLRDRYRNSLERLSEEEKRETCIFAALQSDSDLDNFFMISEPTLTTGNSDLRDLELTALADELRRF